MKLAIELQLLDGSVITSLKREDIKTDGFHDLINDKVLNQSVNLLVESLPDYKPLLSSTTLTDNQRVVILYFMINQRIYSKDLINRWLIDSGLNNIDSKNLASKIYNVHLDNLESIFEASLRLMTHDSNEKLLTYRRSVLYDKLAILNELDPDTTIRWWHDDIIIDQAVESVAIDISQLTETHFEVEDESCIVIGLSVSFTSFIICVASGNEHLLHSLCDIVSIGLRDKYSVSRAMQEFPEIKQVLIESGYHAIDYYGVDKEGALTRYGHFPVDLSNDRQSGLVIPLYIKILK